MEDFPKDIYTEPEPDPDTLANLGPLTGMAGLWTGTSGLDVNPKPDGPETQVWYSSSTRNCSRSMRRPTGRNYSTDCAITRGSSSLTKSKPFTTRSVIGFGNRRGIGISNHLFPDFSLMREGIAVPRSVQSRGLWRRFPALDDDSTPESTRIASLRRTLTPSRYTQL